MIYLEKLIGALLIFVMMPRLLTVTINPDVSLPNVPGETPESGRSLLTNDLNEGRPLMPLGEARNKLANCGLKVAFNVPDVVTGDPAILNTSPGRASPTLVTVPKVVTVWGSQLTPLN